MLSRQDTLALRLQGAVSRALAPLTYYLLAAWMRTRRYRIPEMRRTRAEFAATFGDARGPLLVCANHLTLIDSLVIQWALVPGWRACVRPQWFFWNLPDKHNISATWFFRVIGYVGRCVPVLRMGPPEEARRTLDKVAFLLSRNQVLLVFPEGTRSRSGRVDLDRVMYGVGRMLRETPRARVLCVYARGRGQAEFSDYPRIGETFVVRMRAVTPSTTFQGVRADRDLVTQVARQLIEMEQEYFDDASVDR